MIDLFKIEPATVVRNDDKSYVVSEMSQEFKDVVKMYDYLRQRAVNFQVELDVVNRAIKNVEQNMSSLIQQHEFEAINEKEKEKEATQHDPMKEATQHDPMKDAPDDLVNPWEPKEKEKEATQHDPMKEATQHDPMKDAPDDLVNPWEPKAKINDFNNPWESQEKIRDDHWEQTPDKGLKHHEQPQFKGSSTSKKD